MKLELNKYIAPVSDIENKDIDLLEIVAYSQEGCQEKIMEMYSEFSDSDDYEEFLEDLAYNNILIGDIKDVNELLIGRNNYV